MLNGLYLHKTRIILVAQPKLQTCLAAFQLTDLQTYGYLSAHEYSH
jgi:hypothetical protein